MPTLELKIIERIDIHAEAPKITPNEVEAADREQLLQIAKDAADQPTLDAKEKRTSLLKTKWERTDQLIREACAAYRDRPKDGGRLFSENVPLIQAGLREAKESLPTALKLRHADDDVFGCVPRVYAMGAKLLDAVQYKVSQEELILFLQRAQETSPLQTTELWSLKPFLELAVLERLSESAQEVSSRENGTEVGFPTLFACLQQIVEFDWDQIFEQVSAVEKILCGDPLDAYGRMDPESRHVYRNAVAELAARSDKSEEEIARAAVAAARAPKFGGTERTNQRTSHVGFYLLAEGRFAFKRSIGYRAPLAERLKEAILRWPNTFYFTGMGLLTLAVMFLFAAIPGIRALRWYEVALFFLPALDCAISTLNLFTTMFVPPRKLSKLDFSEGIPSESKTLVVIPMLLGSEEQVKAAVRDLEVRYLGNRDANLHFALLTDPPDSMQQFDEKDVLAEVCSKLIDKLNRKYADDGFGTFYHFHRYRSYNEFEHVWMGWERKRGKLLDLNNLLLGTSDNFPVKTGDLSQLQNVRYVITLDQDTQLPRDTARKLVGALAHPLNRAVIDPETNTVVEGYGILQPRVGISVKSKNRSRLAGLFSGDAGLDIYTRAISDVYQDLFGEGIFTGKGIYEVEAFQTVLDRRFPCNTVLSHDLLEGVYARAGLLSDLEVIDDYPSHVSAYSRRKHRWVRGDWQIMRWLLPKVPNHNGEMVHNPLNLVSRWKIVDNLRRSLTEFAFFLLLLCGWFVLPGKALYWTVATVVAMSIPTYVQFVTSIVRAVRAGTLRADWEDIVSDFGNAQLAFLFRVALLLHQSLVTLDAVVRTIVRMAVTRKSLLQWETAAEAESKIVAKNPVEMYMDWTPWICFGIDILVVVLRPYSILIALPFLTLWGCSKAICAWLNKPFWTSGNKIVDKDRALLRSSALLTWRFFREYSTEAENWLIPDIVEQDHGLLAHRISPTNLGFLLNSRLAAHDLGWSTLPEFVDDSERTFETLAQLPKHDGQLYNWYDTRTLEAVKPRFVSTVDNGNLVCSLWTQKQAYLEASRRPLFRGALRQGIGDHLEIIIELLVEKTSHPRLLLAFKDVKASFNSSPAFAVCWDDALSNLARQLATLEKQVVAERVGEDVRWWVMELSVRIAKLQEMMAEFAPWLLAEFAPYRQLLGIHERAEIDKLTLEVLPAKQAALEKKIREIIAGETSSSKILVALERLLAALEQSRRAAEIALGKLRTLSHVAESNAQALDFAFLYNPQKKQLSIGYDAEKERLHESHYDLLASEARVAVFAAIAKGNIPQTSWFRLGRPRKTYKQSGVLVSWTGTMFEYLLPSLWTRSYPNTLLDESGKTALRAQQDFTAAKAIPWGISESSCSERNPDLHYRYHAFGLPSLALCQSDAEELVIAPYATFLALLVDAPAAMKNLREMRSRGWVGTYGFYDACDFTASRMKPGETCETVRCWMAHHQGMNLVAAASVLGDLSMQRRFHAEPMVAATERLLQEKIPRTGALELELAASDTEAAVATLNPTQPEVLSAN
jgi:cyclic beta-1,2-glucan synthetase